jgi:hypothetical protein
VQICSQCYAQQPDSATHCSECNADLSEYSVTAMTLRRFQENSRVQYVRVTVAQDCCPACREAEGAYSKDTAPKLPIEGCSHALGCRCFYQPFLEDIYP